MSGALYRFALQILRHRPSRDRNGKGTPDDDDHDQQLLVHVGIIMVNPPTFDKHSWSGESRNPLTICIVDVISMVTIGSQTGRPLNPMGFAFAPGAAEWSTKALYPSPGRRTTALDRLHG